MEEYICNSEAKIFKMTGNKFQLHRSEMVKAINGNIFPIKAWPQILKLMFFKMPLSDLQTFKVLVFLIGE